MNVVVIGIGHIFRGDDAAGWEIVNHWIKQYPEIARKVLVEFIDHPGIDLIEFFTEGEVIIIVDAIQSSQKPGTLLFLKPNDLHSFSPHKTSDHGLGISEILYLTHTLYPSLQLDKITLIGIVGKEFGIGKGLSQEVAGNINKAIEILHKEVLRALQP